MMSNHSKQAPTDETFGHPHWDELSREEKIAWLREQIAECLAAGENEVENGEKDFLVRCFEEFDCLTPELAVPEEHVEARLQKILSSAAVSEVPRSSHTRAKRMLRRLTAVLVACAMIAILTPPAYAYVLEEACQQVYQGYVLKEIHVSTIDDRENILPLAQNLEEKEEKKARSLPYSITYRSLEEFLTYEEFDILLPQNMPEDHRIKYITVNYKDEENWTIHFRFYGYMIRSYTVSRAPYQNTNFQKGGTHEEYAVDDRIYYIHRTDRGEAVPHYYAYYTSDNIRYQVHTVGRSVMDTVLDHTSTVTP